VLRVYTGLFVFGLVAATVTAEDLSMTIEKHRKGTVIIRTEPGAKVEVEQLQHEFWFGAAMSSTFFGRGFRGENQKKYEETFLANFNAAVTENAVKWPSMERRQGEVNYKVTDAAADWADEHDIPIRGHNIFWGVEKYVQDWVKELDDDSLRATIKNRAIAIGRRYKGRYVEFDLNNEMLHDNYYAERLGQGITKDMAMWVKEGDPDAVLFLNDYDILTGNKLEEYVTQIRGFLDDGVPISGIGVQGHLHGETFNPAVLKSSLDTLAQFDLPITVTEFNMPGQAIMWKERKLDGKKREEPWKLTEEEERIKAQNLADYFRICFAHPNVHGILFWGFWEGALWIPEAALFRRDWTPTPAADAYRDLVFNEWWTRWEGKADAQGEVRVPAFFGTHKVTVQGQEKTVDLEKAKGELVVKFR
jgi:GH35 family endo-1,4-beta-xylanase